MRETNNKMVSSTVVLKLHLQNNDVLDNLRFCQVITNLKLLFTDYVFIVIKMKQLRENLIALL